MSMNMERTLWREQIAGWRMIDSVTTGWTDGWADVEMGWIDAALALKPP
jgi:hypothetical protein